MEFYFIQFGSLIPSIISAMQQSGGGVSVGGTEKQTNIFSAYKSNAFSCLLSKSKIKVWNIEGRNQQIYVFKHID